MRTFIQLIGSVSNVWKFCAAARTMLLSISSAVMSRVPLFFMSLLASQSAASEFVPSPKQRSRSFMWVVLSFVASSAGSAYFFFASRRAPFFVW